MARLQTLYTARDCADLLKKHVITIYNWNKTGKIKPVAKTKKGMNLYSIDEILRVKSNYKK